MFFIGFHPGADFWNVHPADSIVNDFPTKEEKRVRNGTDAIVSRYLRIRIDIQNYDLDLPRRRAVILC